MMFSVRSRPYEHRRPRKLGLKQMVRSSPKAEVGGSNPLGRANFFNALGHRTYKPAGC
jgi:hypothetical protein